MTGVCIGNSMVCTETWHKYNFEIEEICYDCEKFSAGCVPCMASVMFSRI